MTWWMHLTIALVWFAWGVYQLFGPQNWWAFGIDVAVSLLYLGLAAKALSKEKRTR